MKKKFIAVMAAISIAASITTSFPAAAEDVTLSCSPYIQNMVNIEVTDKNGTPIEGAKLKLMDSSGICRAKFTGNADSGYGMNDSAIKVVPYDDSKTIIKAESTILQGIIPAGHDIVTDDKYIISNDRFISLTDGETEDFTIHHCDNTLPPVLTLSPGTISIYADEAIASKKAKAYIALNDVKYYFKDSTNAINNISNYPINEVITNSTFGVEGFGRSQSGGSASVVPSENETEYIKCRIHVSELNERFNADGTYTLPAKANSSGEPITFNLKNDSSSNHTAFMITSGALVNAVLPDDNGYIEFYVEKESRKYNFKMEAIYSYKKNANTTVYSSNSAAGTFYYADATNITVTAPDFPETGTSLMYVPAGSYTIEADSLPDKYTLSEPMSINIIESENIQSFKVVLDDYEAPTEPPTPEDGNMVYPDDNIVDVVVWGYDGKLVTDAEINLRGGDVNDTFDSGGTHYTCDSKSPIKWFSKNTDEKERYMYIPFDSFKKASGIQNAFAMQIEGKDRVYYNSASLSMYSGQTEKITMYTRDSEDETSFMFIDKGSIGMYVDPKWEQNSAYTGYMLVNDKPIYINPADGSGSYGSVSIYDIGEYTSTPRFGLCEPNTVPESGSVFTEPSILDETTEYVLRRIKLSEISDKFNADGTININDYFIDPRQNKDSARAIIFITSGAMVNAVIPDENGYVEFFAEKDTLQFYLNCAYSHNTTNGHSSASIKAKGVAAQKHTDYYTAPKLSPTGALLTSVPAGEYTLTFTDLPARYKEPGEVKVAVMDINGIQTIEITLEKSYTLGDVNEDGEIDISDATLTLREYAFNAAMLDSELTPAQKLAADVNEDGVIDMNDAAKILKYYAYTLAAIEVDPDTIFKQ